jgi:CO/xanthine dehydrogenase Mo-binding subunit
MIAAEELGIRLEDINITSGDTLITPPCRGAWGTRQTFTAGLAAKLACQDAKKQLFEFASYLLEVSPEDLMAKNGTIYVKEDPQKSIPLAKAASEGFFNMGTPIVGRGVNDDPWSSKPNPKTGIANLTSAYAFATHAAEVEVDTETGCVRILNMYCGHDVGKAINPLTTECQIEGGVVSMGIGYALTEKLIMDKGGVENRNFTDYRILTMADIPNVKTILVETIDPRGPFGAKGVGEPAMIPTAAAIGNAIYNAIGVWIHELPITPEKIIEAIRNKQELKAGSI